MDVKRLKRLEKKLTPEIEAKYWDRFLKQSGCVGNGIYTVYGTNLHSSDTRELFVMFCCQEEFGTKFN